MTQLPDGVYLGLSEADYFAQDAIGSTDLVRLWFTRHGWWWQSKHNPDRSPDKKTDATNYGSALHSVLLEGLKTYEGRYAVAPQKAAGAIETIDQMRAALRGAGLKVDGPGAGTSSWKAADWAEAMENYLPDTPCWPNIQADFDLLRGTRPVVTAVEDRMLRLMHDVAMETPEIAVLLQNNDKFPPLAEVSIFKTLDNGVRRRWRIDRMYPRFDMDLKSLANWHGRPLAFEVGDIIARRGYDIQRADYHEGRAAAYQFIADGFKVYGGTVEQRQWIQQFPERFTNWDWVWLFYQKPSGAGQAPVIFPVYDDCYSELATYGAVKAGRALQFYLEQVARFGLAKPWTHVEPLHFTAEDAKGPRIILPHWIKAETRPTDEEGYNGEL